MLVPLAPAEWPEFTRRGRWSLLWNAARPLSLVTRGATRSGYDRCPGVTIGFPLGYGIEVERED